MFERMMIALIAATLLPLASANGQPQGDPIVSVYSGNTPFMTVSQRQATDQEPVGLYRKSAEGWKRILNGPILFDDHGEPVFRQLALARADQRAYSLVVSDGSLYLVSNVSDTSAPGSILHLGSSETPLIEAGTGQKRFLPKISHASNINIYSQDQSNGGNQVILVSVKFDGATAIGDAMTIAFAVEPIKEHGQLRLLGRPTVLDYEFHDQTLLPKLFLEKSPSEKLVYSKLLVDQVENAAADTDPSIVNRMESHWGEFKNWLGRFVSTMTGERFHTGDNAAKVAFNISTGRPVRNVLFTHTYTNAQIQIEQQYSPLHGTGQISFTQPGGQANITQDGFLTLVNGEPLAANLTEAAVVFVDNVAHLWSFQNGAVAHTVLNLGLNGASVKSFQAVLRSSNTKPAKKFLIYSLKYVTGGQNEGSVTSSVEIQEHSPTTISTTNPLQLIRSFIPQDELGERATLAANGQLLFDTATEPASDVAAYKMTVNPQSPRLNLSMSADAKPVFQYTNAARIVEFEPGLSLAFFQKTQNVVDPSGLYNIAPKAQPTGLEENAIRGQILTRLEPGETIMELESKRFPLARIMLPVQESSEFEFEKRDPRKAYVFAFDPNHYDGKRAFNVAIASNAKTTDDKSFAMSFAQFPFGFDTVSGIRVLRGKKDHKNLLFIVVSHHPKDQTTGKTYLVQVDLKSFNDKSVAAPVPNGAASVIYEGALDEADMNQRFIFSDEGLPYFVKTPELPNDSSNFEVFDLASRESIKPALRGKKIVFNQKEEARGEEVEEYGSLAMKDDWHPYAIDIEKQYPNTAGIVEELKGFESFRDLKAQLDSMANLNQPAKSRILVLPPQLRDLVWQYIMGVYVEAMKAGGPGEKTGFHPHNYSFDLRIFDQAKSAQNQIFANLELMKREATRRQGQKRGLLMARLDQIPSAPLAANAGDTFMIQDVAAGGQAGAVGVEAKKQSKQPASLYLLAAGGPVGLEEFRKNEAPPAYSSMILATPDEMKALESYAPSEIDSGLLKKFEISEIRNPDAESMSDSVSQIFTSDEIKALEYKFSAGDIKKGSKLTPEQSFDVVMEYAISRFQSLVEQKKLSIFESFMRFRTAFATAVLNDREVRRSRVIDKHFIERILTQVFDIPINLNILAEDDPLRLLARKDAALRLQEAGYAGPFDLKNKVIKTILSQTQADAGKPIPSSTILFGETGAGKTFMFKSLMKMLGVKLYDFNSNDNKEAGAIIINVGKIGAGNRGGEDGMSADQAIQHLQAFLSLPNGWRGYILIDDAHANSDENKGKILAWLRGLFESSGGMVNINGVRRPVRNLNVFMTLNPTADQDQISKFAKDKARPTTEEKLLATLSSDKFKVEPSFLRRWGSIINLDYMPAGAKGPELINSLGAASREQLTTSGRVALVDPRVVEQIVRQSETLDARTFLSASVSSLMQSINETSMNGSIAMVIPSVTRLTSPMGAGGTVVHGRENVSAADQISQWVAKNTRVISLDGSIEGNLANLRLIVDAFRIPVYEFLVNAVVEEPRFSGDEMTQKRLLTPILMAIHDHIKDRGAVPLSALHISAADFGAKTQAERQQFRDLLQRMSSTDEEFFPIHIHASNSQESWDDLLGNAEKATGRSRNDVLFETMQKLHVATREHLNRVMHTEDVDRLSDPGPWIASLRSQDDPKIKTVGRDIASTLWDYLPNIFDERLIEVRDARAPMSTYVATRLFLYALDKSVVELPWVHLNHFMLKTLDQVAQDQVLSQQPGVQAFLFSNRYRLVKPTTPDLINQIIASSPAYLEAPAAYRERLQTEFSSNCESYLTPPHSH